MDAIGRAGFWAAKQKFEDFAFGFNQAAERFVMVDVGSGKEAADAKIKVILEDNVRLPQTCKILFGGELCILHTVVVVTNDHAGQAVTITAMLQAFAP